jgi:hypothetical protein
MYEPNHLAVEKKKKKKKQIRRAGQQYLEEITPSGA